MENKYNNDSLKNKDSNTRKRRSPSVLLSGIIIKMRYAVSIIMSIYCVYDVFCLSSVFVLDSNV